MVKTKKQGVLYKGVIQKAGALLSLPTEDEARLVRQGWCSYVESWPAGQPDKSQEQSEGQETTAPADQQEEDTQEKAAEPEDGPQTGLPEEEQPKRTRSRKK